MTVAEMVKKLVQHPDLLRRLNAGDVSALEGLFAVVGIKAKIIKDETK